MSEHFDVLIIGAGLSGISAAVHLQKGCPEKRYAILEARASLGGTWDLFRYPGIRSDSDMFTLGFAFKPWKAPRAIADGPTILAYLRETAQEYGVESHIRYEHRVVGASWSSERARWTVQIERGPSRERAEITCDFLHVCSGYYDYDQGYTPEFRGRERFRGRIVHPQFWSDDVEYANKRVIVIGSGATAVTLVPELAQKAAHVVMLQRSPTYMFTLPTRDPVADALRARLPAQAAYDAIRTKNVVLGMIFYQLSRRQPEFVKRRLLSLVRKELGPEYDVEKHFTPKYAPWDQRVCVVADGDMFAAIRDGRAEVVTDTIETFTETGVRLASGRELEADLVVTATGLSLKFMGGMKLTVDGREVEPGKLLNYKGTMFSDVPNLACTFGYTNASWTLKADLTSAFVARLLRHMKTVGARVVTPRVHDAAVSAEPFLPLSAGYVLRAVDLFPKQGSKIPWRLFQNYFVDVALFRLGRIDDGALEFRA